ncbi:hypothetical protein I4U23_004953 [Adineta vaga]|nr:hypothetical protein I4U23_004953 [Adineta vaga]
MINFFFFLFFSSNFVLGRHFNGGTIRWEPINPTINSSIVSINIIQTYSWTYPTISCANDVPITTNGRSNENTNLTCVTDCSTDGGYSANPIDILTDCQSFSTSLGMMTSQRSVNINLTAYAHFYLAYVGTAWIALNDPAESGLEWSIVCSIDLRMRPDGFINTPPVANIISPQYAIVNQTTLITIPVSDANSGDDIRCRWSRITPGYRRRKRSNEEEHSQMIHIRKKRRSYCSNCGSTCAYDCYCSCSGCAGTICSGRKCSISGGCPIGTTTTEIPGTLKTTISYPNRQPIDECGGICFPNSVPNTTTLTGCTISFTGLIPDTWYGIALQVEDFIDSNSNVSMSSVPVQFLIYVMAQPPCGLAPIILSLDHCLDVQVGVLITFNISAMTLCDPIISNIDTIVATSIISGMNISSLVTSSINSSISYVTFTWQPQINQLGSQQFCTLAYSDEQIQSQQYCVTFDVISSVSSCAKSTKTKETTKETNWPLIVGLSLLALLLALCCSCCCCLYWFYWVPLGRRRRQRSTKDEYQQNTILPRIPRNMSDNNHPLNQILGVEKIRKKQFNYNQLTTNDNIERTSPSDIPLHSFNANPSNSLTTMRNSEQNINSRLSLTKQSKAVNIIRINKNEKPVESMNNNIKTETDAHSITTIVGTNKGEERIKRLSTISNEKSRSTSISIIQANEIELVQQNNDKIQRKSSIPNKLRSTSVTKEQKPHVKSGVIVTKVPRHSTVT